MTNTFSLESLSRMAFETVIGNLKKKLTKKITDVFSSREVTHKMGGFLLKFATRIMFPQCKWTPNLTVLRDSQNVKNVKF